MGMGMGRAVEDGKCESVGVSVVTPDLTGSGVV